VKISRRNLALYKVVQIWPGQTVTCLHTNSPGHIWTTLLRQAAFWVRYKLRSKKKLTISTRAWSIVNLVVSIRNVTIRRKRGQARYKYASCRDFLKAVASLKPGESKRSYALCMLRTANIFQVLVFVRLCCTCTCERRHCFSVANICVSDGLFQSLLITPTQTRRRLADIQYWYYVCEVWSVVAHFRASVLQDGTRALLSLLSGARLLYASLDHRLCSRAVPVINGD
jgi:hypothetical protein